MVIIVFSSRRKHSISLVTFLVFFAVQDGTIARKDRTSYRTPPPDNSSGKSTTSTPTPLHGRERTTSQALASSVDYTQKSTIAAATVTTTQPITTKELTDAKRFLEEQENTVLDFAHSTGLCEPKFAIPHLQKHSCRGRCGDEGRFRDHFIYCSCHPNCVVIDFCCFDMHLQCPRMTRLAHSLLPHPGFHLDLTCELQGYVSVLHCSDYDHIATDIKHFGVVGSKNITTTTATNISSIRLEELRDYLGNSVEKIEDKANGFIYRGRTAYSTCKLPNSVPAFIPRVVTLDCSTHGVPSIVIPQRPVGQDQLSPDTSNATLASLASFLQGCNVSGVVDVYTPTMRKCPVRSAINCYNSHGGTLIKTLSELCDPNSRPLVGPSSYPLFSDQGVYTELQSGITCYHVLESDAPNLVKTQSLDLPSEESALLTIVESVRDEKETGNELPSGEFQAAVDEHGYLSGRSYTVKISTLRFEAFLACPGLDTHLRDCRFVNGTALSDRSHTRASETAGVTEKTRWREDNVMLHASVYLVGQQEQQDASIVPPCTCMMLHAALASLQPFSVIATNSIAEGHCVLHLRPFQPDLRYDSPNEFSNQIPTRLDLWQRSIAVALKKAWGQSQITPTTDEPTRITAAVVNYTQQDLQNGTDVELSTERFLKKTAQLKEYVEHYITSKDQMCPYDRVFTARLCLSVQGDRVQFSATQIGPEKCLLIGLGPSNDARRSGRGWSEFATVLFVTLMALCPVKYVPKLGFSL